MIKGVLSNFFIDLKKIYWKILPKSFLLGALTLITVQTKRYFLSPQTSSNLHNIVVTIVGIYLYSFLLIFGLYIIKNELNNNSSLMALGIEIKENFIQIIKLILKRESKVMLGYVLLIIPGIIFTINWYLVYPLYEVVN